MNINSAIELLRDWSGNVYEGYGYAAERYFNNISIISWRLVLFVQETGY
jgi:hypothetical protein